MPIVPLSAAAPMIALSSCSALPPSAGPYPRSPRRSPNSSRFRSRIWFLVRARSRAAAALQLASQSAAQLDRAGTIISAPCAEPCFHPAASRQPPCFPFSVASQQPSSSRPAGPAYDLTRPTACRGSRGRERPLLPRCAQSAPYIGREGKARVARAAARMAALGRWP